ncbi:hypothetical protein NM688_g3305 [Phlebia brevispora]|uniref:Uncharacterized protein n=1 Tax=Phlebia brevispora TaxID=194682 RepID=A0ACC1T6T3_9APHY|nr:hypothetical protein NM688_g3305 [Phlebia brevispora]
MHSLNIPRGAIIPDSTLSSRNTTTASRYPSRRQNDASTTEGRPKRKKYGQEASNEDSNSSGVPEVPQEHARQHESTAETEVASQPSAAAVRNTTLGTVNMDAGDSSTEDGEEIDNAPANTKLDTSGEDQRPAVGQPETTGEALGSQEEAPAELPTDPMQAAQPEAQLTDSQRLPRIVVPAVLARPVIIQNPGWVMDNVMLCLQVIATRDKLEKHRFALSRVDFTETVFGGYDGSFLCWKQKALTVLFLGRVRSTYFTAGANSEPARCASVRFKFLSEADDTMARLLVHSKAQPPVGKSILYFQVSITNIYARYFSKLYDGTKEIRAKHLMMKLPNYELRANDIALFECQVQCYTEKGQRRNTWMTWGTNFKLLNIVKVLSAPASVPEEDESEDELVQRADTDDEEEAY